MPKKLLRKSKALPAPVQRVLKRTEQRMRRGFSPRAYALAGEVPTYWDDPKATAWNLYYTLLRYGLDEFEAGFCSSRYHIAHRAAALCAQSAGVPCIARWAAESGRTQREVLNVLRKTLQG